MDIQRYLGGETVLACPPSRTYRFRKFAQQNRGALAAIAAVAIAVVLGTAAATWQAVRATESKREAQAEANKARAVADLLREILAQASPFRNAKGDYTVIRMVDEFAGRLDGDLGSKLEKYPQAEVEIRTLLGRYYNGLLLPNKSAPQVERALKLLRQSPGSEENPQVVRLLVDQGWNEISRGNHAAAERLGREALPIAERSPRSAPDAMHARAVALLLLQSVCVRQRQYDEADDFGHRALALADADKNVDKIRVPILADLSNSAAGRGQFEEAERYARTAIKDLEGRDGPDSLRAAWTYETLGYRLEEQGKHDEAELYARKALTILKRELGNGVPDSIHNLLITILTNRGDKAGVDKLLDERRIRTGQQSPSTRP
jgi:tetratricopeptide (TPR) repeat protein